MRNLFYGNQSKETGGGRRVVFVLFMALLLKNICIQQITRYLFFVACALTNCLEHGGGDNSDHSDEGSDGTSTALILNTGFALVFFEGDFGLVTGAIVSGVDVNLFALRDLVGDAEVGVTDALVVVFSFFGEDGARAVSFRVVLGGDFTGVDGGDNGEEESDGEALHFLLLCFL